MITCSLLKPPANGKVTQFGNSPGSLALYRCNSGFEIENGMSNALTCGDDGEWSGQVPQCKRMSTYI